MDHVYHLAANMGGIGFIETNKAVIVHDNTLINPTWSRRPGATAPRASCTPSSASTPAACGEPGHPHLKWFIWL